MTHGPDESAPRDELEPAAPRRDLLRVEVSDCPSGVRVLAPVGEIDAATAGVLRDAACAAVAARPRSLLVDLGGLTFCGSTGLVVLMEALRACDAVGIRFATADGPPIVRRVLDITRLGPFLRHRETVAAALRDWDA